MPADIIACAEAAGVFPQDDDALAADFLKYVIAGIGDTVLASDAEPATQEDPLDFPSEELGRFVLVARQGHRAIEGDFSAFDECGHGAPRGTVIPVLFSRSMSLGNGGAGTNQ